MSSCRPTAQIALPFPVLTDDARATFDKAKRTLEIFLPVEQVWFISRLTRAHGALQTPPPRPLPKVEQPATIEGETTEEEEPKPSAAERDIPAVQPPSSSNSSATCATSALLPSFAPVTPPVSHAAEAPPLVAPSELHSVPPPPPSSLSPPPPIRPDSAIVAQLNSALRGSTLMELDKF